MPQDYDLLNLQEVYVDPLTGLGNLFSCLSDLAGHLKASSTSDRLEDGRLVSFFLVDVDGLAELNEVRGNTSGDEALLLVRNTLMDVATEGVRVYRFSGDEFAVVGCEGCAESPGDFARQIVETYRVRAQELFEREPVPTVSVGGIAGPQEGATTGELLMLAYRALARAKRRGRNTVSIVRRTARTREQREGELLSLFAREILETLDLALDAGRLALTDPLTGLPNQRAAEHELRLALRQSVELERPLAILLIDGDRLKTYNEQYGYTGGNRMIRNLVSILSENKREDDFLARWFVGDEFLLLLFNANESSAIKVAERIRQDVEEQTAAWELPVTVSIGVAVCPTDSKVQEELLRLAEEANYRAKSLGKNRVVCATELGRRA